MKKFHIIIIIHGSKEKKWIIFCKKIKFFLKKKNKKKCKIYISFTKNKKPYLLNIINKNIKKITYDYLIIPLFLSKGKHIKKDLKIILKNILKIYKNVIFFKINCINKNKNIIKSIKKEYLRIINKYIFIKNL